MKKWFVFAAVTVLTVSSIGCQGRGWGRRGDTCGSCSTFSYAPAESACCDSCDSCSSCDSGYSSIQGVMPGTTFAPTTPGPG